MSTQLLSFLGWYLAALLAGLAALPLSFQLFRHLPDRGYTFSKALGLLAAGWVFWFLGSVGFLRNDATSVLFAALVVAVAGLVWLGRPGLSALRAWLSAQRGLVLGAEALFLASFALMAFIRFHDPNILGTEKPMEFMFMNSILRSPAFPAQDAWLAGHAISYYYFGYVIVTALARVTSTASSVAFNLGLSLMFALIAAGAHGVVLNLIALQKERVRSLTAAYWPALLGPVLVLLVGNFYGLAELAYTNGYLSNTNIWAVRYYFGQADPANAADVQANTALTDPAVSAPGIRAGPVNFWSWLDLKQALPPLPAAPAAFNWNAGGNWFYGARVVHDRNLNGEEVEAIDEMPAFSFLLGDMHPHVLSLPFVVLAIGLSLEWLLWGASEWESVVGPSSPVTSAGQAPLALFTSVLRRPKGAFVIPFVLTALVLGGLSFLNTWDFPIYLFLVVVSFALGLGLRHGWKALAPAWWRLGVLAVALAVVSVALYFPFYLTFQSQAGGILPNVIWPTRFQQTIVFFGPPLIGVTIYLAWLAVRGRRSFDWRAALAAGAGIVVVLVLVEAILVLAAFVSPTLRSSVESSLSPLSLSDALGLAAQRRVVDSAATFYPALLIALCVGLAVGVLRPMASDAPAPVSETAPAEAAEPELANAADPEPASVADRELAGAVEPEPAGAGETPRRTWRRGRAESPSAYLNAGRSEVVLAQPAVLMALAMLLTGALLLIGPEWVYLRDNFLLRMNTIFKFYFQTWTLWSLVAAFGIWHMAQAARRLTRWAAAGLLALAALGGLVYTGITVRSIFANYTGAPTLDGMAWFAAQNPDEWAGIRWLADNVSGLPVVAEAVGGAYNIDESRMAMGTGLPTVMGWTNHEGQWRGASYALVAERPDQIKSLYQVRDWTATQAILDRYQIEYVVIGNEERSKYNPIYLPKFDNNMDSVFKSGTLTIYRRKPTAAQ